MSNISVGSNLELVGAVGPKQYESFWLWKVQVIGETPKALKVTAEGAGKKYAWLPKSVIKEAVQNDKGFCADLSRFGVEILRRSYIARESCEGELLNFTGHGIARNGGM